MMRIISHRGYWKRNSEKNSSKAFNRSFSLNLGTETDVRDFNGRLVISHDIATKRVIPIDNLFSLYNTYNMSEPLALNIKSDGIRKKLRILIDKYGIENYFVFDMSVPEQVLYIKEGFRTFTRQSEYEQNPVLYEKSTGVWIDGFTRDWVTESVIMLHLKNRKMVALVSPDLHKRDYKRFWIKLSKLKCIKNNNVILCTDHPEEARRFFYDKN